MTLSPLTDGTQVRVRDKNLHGDVIVEPAATALPGANARAGGRVQSVPEYLAEVRPRRVLVPLRKPADKAWAKAFLSDANRDTALYQGGGQLSGNRREVIVVIDTGDFLRAADALELNKLGAIIDAGPVESFR